MGEQRKLSRAGLEFIKSYEKFSPTVYLDQGGRETIGYGHLIRQHEDIGPVPWTMERGLQQLATDVLPEETCISAWCAKVPLQQHEVDALVSLAFNIGVGNFQHSTLLRKLQAGDKAACAAEFPRWDKVNGQPSHGLDDRRKAECDIFFGRPNARYPA